MKTDFSLNHEGDWRNGEMPKHISETIIVNYDQRNRAYRIDPTDRADFIEWVAQNWEIDSDPREEDEDAAEYLARIGVRLIEQ